MASNTALSVANLDFDSIKSNIKAYLNNQKVFADYDFEGSNFAALIDAMAYNTYLNNYYLNMVANEGFIDTAQIKESVVSHAKTLNYLPKSRSSSVADISIRIYPDDDPSQITIPAYTKFTSTVDGASYIFSTNSAIVVTSNSEGAFVADTKVYEGKVIEEFFTANTSLDNQRFVLTNEGVDTSSLTVKVRASSSDDTTTEYSKSETTHGMTSVSNNYFVLPANASHYELQFGDGTIGRALENGNVIEATYRVASGNVSNGGNTFVKTTNIGGYSNVVITTVNPAVGGSPEEDINAIKFAAPKNLTIQDRLVTESDYETLLKQQFTDIESLSVYGGEKEDPPRFGKVVIAVDVANADGVPDGLKQMMKDYIKNRAAIGITPEIVDPEFLYVDVTSTVNFNTNETTKGKDDIQSLVDSKIDTWSNNNINGFNKVLRLSKLTEAMDDADDSILNNDTEFKLRKNWTPTAGNTESKTLFFNNKIDSDVQNNIAGVQSDKFTYGTDGGSYIKDDGNGILLVVTANTANVADTTTLKSDAGTVDYETGKVTISSVNVAAYTNSAIRISARTEARQANSAQNIILQIGEKNTTVNAEVI